MDIPHPASHLMRSTIRRKLFESSLGFTLLRIIWWRMLVICDKSESFIDLNFAFYSMSMTSPASITQFSNRQTSSKDFLIKLFRLSEKSLDRGRILNISFLNSRNFLWTSLNLVERITQQTSLVKGSTCSTMEIFTREICSSNLILRSVWKSFVSYGEPLLLIFFCMTCHEWNFQIDFQLSVYCSPAVDLTFAFDLVKRDESGELPIDEITTFYHEQFVAALKGFGFTKPHPTLIELNDELSKHGTIQVLRSIFFIPFRFVDQVEKPEEDGRDGNYRKLLYNYPKCKMIFQKLLNSWVEKGWLWIESCWLSFSLESIKRESKSTSSPFSIHCRTLVWQHSTINELDVNKRSSYLRMKHNADWF